MIIFSSNELILQNDQAQYKIYDIKYNQATNTLEKSENLDSYFFNASMNGFTFKRNCHLRIPLNLESQLCSNSILRRQTQMQNDDSQVLNMLNEQLEERTLSTTGSNGNQEITQLSFNIDLDSVTSIKANFIITETNLSYCISDSNEVKSYQLPSL